MTHDSGAGGRRDVWRRVAAGLMACALGASAAAATGPREQVERTVAAVRAVIDDPALQGPAHEAERRERVRRIIHEAFAFEDMARAALGESWSRLGPAERTEFSDLFGDLFESSYNALVLRFLGASATTFGAETIEDGQALVRTTLVRPEEGELPVDYRLVEREPGRWAMADVVVDGVSLARNYRAQFEKILRRGSYATLVEKMRLKLAAARAE